MSNLSNNSVETVNAAATAIVTAESRVQPTSVEKRRWGSCWSQYWCFGSHNHSKRIGHATLMPEATAPGATAPVSETLNLSSSTIVFPFIAPPSSPASFLQSEPPSATQSPAGGLLSLTPPSVSAYNNNPGGPASIFAVGPYTYETQLVSPPVFSTFTTEPSTANFTPPPEPMQFTTPSSPEVPFAQLLASSLRSSGKNQTFALSQYEFRPYGISPGSTIPNSGTSSPFPDKQPRIEFPVGEPPKFLGYDYFSSQKGGSRLGSGSLTPNGLGSGLASGSLTPSGGVSRLGSGSLTPNAGEPVPVSRGNLLMESQISEVASLANSDGSQDEEEVVTGHRVSFELHGEDVPTCLEKHLSSSPETVPKFKVNSRISKKEVNSCDCVMSGKTIGDGQEKQCKYQHHLSAFGSSKEFNFDNTKDVVGKELEPKNNWTFFPMLQSEIS